MLRGAFLPVLSHRFQNFPCTSSAAVAVLAIPLLFCLWGQYSELLSHKTEFRWGPIKDYTLRVRGDLVSRREFICLNPLECLGARGVDRWFQGEVEKFAWDFIHSLTAPNVFPCLFPLVPAFPSAPAAHTVCCAAPAMACVTRSAHPLSSTLWTPRSPWRTARSSREIWTSTFAVEVSAFMQKHCAFNNTYIKKKKNAAWISLGDYSKNSSGLNHPQLSRLNTPVVLCFKIGVHYPSEYLTWL